MLNNCILIQIASRCVCVFVVGVCVCICGRCVCVFVVGVCVCICGRCVCVCFWLCLLVVSNASLIDLFKLLSVITAGEIEMWNQWFDVQF